MYDEFDHESKENRKKQVAAREALEAVIGEERFRAEIGLRMHTQGLDVKEAALLAGISEEDFNTWVPGF